MIHFITACARFRGGLQNQESGESMGNGQENHVGRIQATQADAERQRGIPSKFSAIPAANINDVMNRLRHGGACLRPDHADVTFQCRSGAILKR